MIPRKYRNWLAAPLAVATLLLSSSALAQGTADAGAAAPAGGAGAPPATAAAPALSDPLGGPSVAPTPNVHLPSSSRASGDTSSSGDGFDLTRAGGQNATVVRGGKSGAYIVSGQYVPKRHTAKRGDTLWSISSRYYGNPYNWPRVWSYNKQIQNPHWIYPGDHISLRGGYGVRQVGGFVRPRALVTPDTKFQRHYGYVLDGPHDLWGEIIGSPEDQMLLSETDEVYIRLDEGKEDGVKVGQLLTLFEPRKVKSLSPYGFVWVRGLVKVNRINKKTRTVRARIVESLDTIERGVMVGPMDRKIDVVAPKRNRKTIEARIVGALYPYEFYGQGQVVFLDKGSRDGVEVGNRFFAVSRGDEWRLGLKNAGNMADKRAITEDDRMARVERTPNRDKPKLYPVETYAEIMVTRVRETTATCLVIASIREISRGSVVIARKGY